MQLVLDEDQTMLAETARQFITDHCPLGRVRALRDDDTGFDASLWRQMVDLGWPGMPFDERDGGLGLGIAEIACVTEALGRGLATEPFFSNVLLAGACIARAGSPAQRAAWLAPMIAGQKQLALAATGRHPRFDPYRVGAGAERTSEGYRLTGAFAQVLGGHVADACVVVARTGGTDGDRDGLTLFLVPCAATGVRRIRQRRVDAAPAALVHLEDVRVTEAEVLGAPGHAADVLDDVYDVATIALAAEMLGGMSRAFEMTLQYLKERVQFGVPIGSFQALKHRAARLFIEIELTRSAVMAAARAPNPERPGLASVAKARASDAFVRVAEEAIQMHGGIGMTDEHDIGFFLKRARAAEMTLGDAAYHRARYAVRQGF
jgi:alkylation response protein AidB-like acyl-CoA dehydrogenase